MKKGVVQKTQKQPAVAINKNCAGITAQINDTHTRKKKNRESFFEKTA